MPIDAGKLLNDNNVKELHVMRGLLQNPMESKTTGGAVYYVFDLKVLKSYGDDEEYGQSYNLYHCIVPADIAQSISLTDMKAFKGNEVTVLCTTRCSVRKHEASKFNNASFYAQTIELYRKVNIGSGVQKSAAI